MRTGNVIKCPSGDLWIVIRVTDDIVEAVSFDSENVHTVQALEDHERNEWFYDGDCSLCFDDCQQLQDECCGHYLPVAVKGWKHSKVIAPTVNAFILDGIKKHFGLR